MVRVKQEDYGVAGIALSAVVGIGVGVIGGLFLWEWLGDRGTEPIRNVVRRLRPTAADEPDEDLDGLERATKRVFEESSALAEFDLDAEALGDGIVDITGIVPDEPLRELAGELAGQVPGADVVVNRVLVEGHDTLPRKVTLELDKD
ncbi:MAG: BON domain-containing protein [Gemmatimonadales bacterium]